MESNYKSLQSKKLYETILSSGNEIQLKKQAVLSLIKLAITDHSHFSFLLNQIDWFCESNVQLIPLLAKILRVYRGTSKTASKVVYNLLTEGLSIPKINMLIVDLLDSIVHSYKDTSAVIQSIRQNYPHKVCGVQNHIAYIESLLELSLRNPNQRFCLLEIVIQNILAFDTEMTLGEKFISDIDQKDQEILALSQSCEPFQHKYDQILEKLLKFVSKFDKIGKELLLKQIYLIFQKTIMVVDNTKMIQYLIFYLAQTSPQVSQCFITLLMVTIFQNYNCKQQHKKKFIAALQYLRSYIGRSLHVSQKRIKKIFLALLSQLKQKLSTMPVTNFQDLSLKQFGEQNMLNFYMLETVIYMKWKFPHLLMNQNVKNNFNSLISSSKQKLHYQIFIDQNLLVLANMNSKQNQVKSLINSYNDNFSTKFVQKFIPIFLPRSQKIIEMKIKISGKRDRPNWSMQQSTEIGSGGIPCKKINSGVSSHGGYTPLTVQQYLM